LQARLALISSAGLSQADQPPMDADNIEGDYSIRLLDIEREPSELTIHHSHFDDAAEADINVVYPIDRLRDLVATGLIGGLANPAVSFMGYFSNVFRVRDEVAPRVVDAVKASGADAALLVPV
jgi:D-proline reductase (dithiol) PrdB